MDVVSSRVLPRPTDLARTQAFYGDLLGLAVYREFGPPDHRGDVYLLGNGLLKVSGQAEQPPAGPANREVCVVDRHNTWHTRAIAGQTKALTPVIARPTMRDWIESVPS